MIEAVKYREEFFKSIINASRPLIDEWHRLRPELDALEGVPTEKLTAFEVALNIPETDAVMRLRLYQDYDGIKSDDREAVKSCLEDIIQKTTAAAPELKGRKNTTERLQNATLYDEARHMLSFLEGGK